MIVIEKVMAMTTKYRIRHVFGHIEPTRDAACSYICVDRVEHEPTERIQLPWTK